MADARGERGGNGGRGSFWGTECAAYRVGEILLRLLDATAGPDEVETHVHDHPHLIYVIRGSYVSSAEDAPPVAAVPVLIANPAGTRHRDHFAVPGGRFLDVSLPEGCVSLRRPKAVRDLAILAVAHGLARDLVENAPPIAIEEKALLLAGPSWETRPAKARPAWIERAYEMLMEMPPRSLGIAGLAAEAGVHPAHFARTFRRHVGRTAGELVRGRQFERACRLLRDTDEPLAEIAQELGFHDQAHFTHAFRARSGLAPGRWRRTIRVQ